MIELMLIRPGLLPAGMSTISKRQQLPEELRQLG
jgi:hypothetical protein